jgi:hypothetical protein
VRINSYYQTGHDCTNFVKVGEAARTCGVAYQYIYGLATRNHTAARPRLALEARYVAGRTKPIYTVCLDCCIAKYGTAQPSDGSNDILLAAPLIGYRSWYINKDFKLCSWRDSEFVWEPNGVEAQCKRGHVVPGPRCSCGLYSKNSFEGLRSEGYDRTGDCRGQVQLWGRYHEGDRGYRVQWGRAIALLCDNWKAADDVHEVARRYQIGIAHGAKLLESTDWGALKGLEGGVLDEHWRGDEAGRSSSASGSTFGAGTARRAACRDAAAGASTIAQLKHLVAEGIISSSNVSEMFEV